MDYSTSLNLTQSRRSFIKAAGATLVACLLYTSDAADEL